MSDKYYDCKYDWECLAKLLPRFRNRVDILIREDEGFTFIDQLIWTDDNISLESPVMEENYRTLVAVVRVWKPKPSI